MSTDYIVIQLARVTVGVAIGAAFGAGGYFLGWAIWNPLTGPWWLLAWRASGAALGAGVGGFVGWIRPDAGRTSIAIGFVAAVIGGNIGVYVAPLYRAWTSGEPPATRGDVLPMLLGAILAANIVGWAVFIRQKSADRGF